MVNTLKEYSCKPDTPAKSPVGHLMVNIPEKYPDLNFEDARTKANKMIQKAAGRMKYHFPKVYSEAEIQTSLERRKQAKAVTGQPLDTDSRHFQRISRSTNARARA